MGDFNANNHQRERWQDPKWTMCTNRLQVPCANHSASYIGNNKIVIVGGQHGRFGRRTSALDGILLYDVRRQTIQRKASLNTPIFDHQSVFVQNDGLYLTGGRSGQPPDETEDRDAIYFIDCSDDQYDGNYLEYPMAVGRSGHSSVNYYGAIYTIGGAQSHTIERSYFPSTEMDPDVLDRSDWDHNFRHSMICERASRRCADLRVSSACMEVVDDCIYIFGGLPIHNRYGTQMPSLNSVRFIYPKIEVNPVRNEVSGLFHQHPNGTSIPFQLFGAASVSIGKWIILIGGDLTYYTPESGTVTQTTDTCFLYNVSTNIWHMNPDASNLLSPRKFHTACVMENGRIVVTGGSNLIRDDAGAESVEFLNSIESIHYLALFPTKDGVRDSVLRESYANNELPIHTAARHNLKWIEGMELLVKSIPAMVTTRNSIDGDLPIVLAASHRTDTCLTTVFMMLQITIGVIEHLNYVEHSS
jgi:hypothetical protein